ncbi:MAG: DUF4126 domain-containing protein [Clostridia bacterium]|nr:DUF4126 domain-containing protein [Clostridia bacterium]
MTKSAALRRSVGVLCAVLLLAAIVSVPSLGASEGDLFEEVAGSKNVLGEYATESINGVLGAYALIPLDPMFNLAILSGVSLLSHGGTPVNSGIQKAIESNVLLNNQVVCWILFATCLLIGIAHLILKYVPGLSAATESVINKIIDGLGIIVRFTPYLILILPAITPAASVVMAGGFQTVLTAGGKWAIGFVTLLASIVQYLVIKFARAFFDLIVALSPEPFTTAVVDVLKKTFSIILWVLALYAPEVLVVINILIFLLALIVARKGFLLTKYCRGLYWKSFKHALRKKRGTLNPQIYAARSAAAPGYVVSAFPNARRIMACYAGSRLGPIRQLVPKYLAGWLVDDESGLYFCAKPYHLFRKKILLTGPGTLITGWNRCRIQIDAADGTVSRLDLSVHYALPLRVLAEERGWRNLTEEKKKRKIQKKADKQKKSLQTPGSQPV